MIFDAIILALLILFFYNGLKRGFIRSAYSMLSLVISVVLVHVLHDSFVTAVAASPIGETIGNFFAGSYGGFLAEECSRAAISVVSIVLLYFIVKIALRMLINVIDLLAKLPLIKSVNKLLGGIFGVLSGAVWVILITNIGYYFPQLKALIDASKIVKAFGILFV